MSLYAEYLVMIVLALSAGRGQHAPSTQPAATTHPATGFLCKTVTLDGETYAYSVFVPPEYAVDKPWPAILFLHGSGERGDDGLLQTDVGIGRVLRRNHQLIPAIVVMPQCRPAAEAFSGTMAQMVLRCLDQTCREYNVDPQRVYLTGLSMGGHGAWHIAADNPGRFAAVVPICGFAEWQASTGVAERLAKKLTSVPIWCFHGAKDDVVPVEKAREMVAAIRAVGGDIKYTEYPDGNHGVWDRTYDDPELWKWLLAQRRGAMAPPAP